MIPDAIIRSFVRQGVPAAERHAEREHVGQLRDRRGVDTTAVSGRQQGVLESTLRHDSPAADRERPTAHEA